MTEMTRRKLLTSASITAAVALAGCSAVLGPDSKVTDTETSQSFGELFQVAGLFTCW
jgi:hypothetical protein